MRIFPRPNLAGGYWKCRICGTSDINPVFLVMINGTQDGNIGEADQIHVHCVDLTFYEPNTLAMKFEVEPKPVPSNPIELSPLDYG